MKLRKEVLWFARQMETKLRENDHRGGWDDSNTAYLFRRLSEERRELRRVFDADEKRYRSGLSSTREYPVKLAREAADVANFAMMIADNARRKT